MRNGFMGGFGVVMPFAGVFFYQRNRIKIGLRASIAEKLRPREKEKGYVIRGGVNEHRRMPVIAEKHKKV